MAKKRLHPGLIALSASAIAAVYTVGYVHTQPVDAALAAAASSPASITAPAPTTAPPPPIFNAAPPATSGAPTSTGRGLSDDSRASNSGVPQTLGRSRRERESDGDDGFESSRGRLLAPPNVAPGTQTNPAPWAPTNPAPSTTSPAPSTAAPPTTSAAPTGAYKDGTYAGAGTSRFGGVEVSVTVAGGKITNVGLTRVTTKYPASRIAALPGQVVSRQSAQVNNVSGATASASAFRAAVQAALSKAA